LAWLLARAVRAGTEEMLRVCVHTQDQDRLVVGEAEMFRRKSVRLSGWSE
jgi:hypothetical protein